MGNSKRFFFTLAGWGVHLFTALGSVLGLLTLYAIVQQHILLALWLMWGTILIDAFDGTLARAVHIKEYIPKIDGALLDNIIDYLNYVITPAFFILIVPVVPPTLKFFTACLIALVSCYQFTQADAKTDDHFFKGFPSYWNITVFYLFIFHANVWVAFWVLITCSILIFVPIKYVYPSRLDCSSESHKVRGLTFIATCLYVTSAMALLWFYPDKPIWIVSYNILYGLLYLFLSLYRTIQPLKVLIRS